MKKILFVFSHPAPYKVRLFNELARDFDLTVLFERKSNSDRPGDYYFESGYRFKYEFIKGIPVGNENVISNGIVKHLKNNKYDLIIMNGYSSFAEISAINYLRKNHIPFVFYINGGIAKQHESSIRKNFKTKMISSASCYFSPDETSNEYLIHYGAKKERIINYPYSSIYNEEVLKTPLTITEKKMLRNKHNIPFEKVFVSSGQLIKRKNYLELINLWKDQPSNYGLLILGDGKQKRKIENFMRKNEIHNVRLLGFKHRAEMFEYFKLSDAFIFPSLEDIYGHVILEALSQGIPVVSTSNVNAAKRAVINGYNGYVLNELNKVNLTNAIESVLNDDLSQNCLDTAMKYTIEQTHEHHRVAFNEVMK